MINLHEAHASVLIKDSWSECTVITANTRGFFFSDYMLILQLPAPLWHKESFSMQVCMHTMYLLPVIASYCSCKDFLRKGLKDNYAIVYGNW